MAPACPPMATSRAVEEGGRPAAQDWRGKKTCKEQRPARPEKAICRRAEEAERAQAHGRGILYTACRGARGQKSESNEQQQRQRLKAREHEAAGEARHKHEQPCAAQRAAQKGADERGPAGGLRRGPQAAAVEQRARSAAKGGECAERQRRTGGKAQACVQPAAQNERRRRETRPEAEKGGKRHRKFHGSRSFHAGDAVKTERAGRVCAGGSSGYFSPACGCYAALSDNKKTPGPAGERTLKKAFSPPFGGENKALILLKKEKNSGRMRHFWASRSA